MIIFLIHNKTNPKIKKIEYKKKPFNIVMIYVNCFNRNRLGIFGNSPSPTPNIDKFAKNAFIFKNYFSPASYTRPCTYELLTSNFFTEKLPDYEKTIENLSFQFLKEKGYNFYFPSSIFGKVNFKDLKEPFLFFEHPDTLHDPYDPEFKRINNYYDNYTSLISSNIKKYEEKNNPIDINFYRNIFGYPSNIYLNNIKNWKQIIDNINKNKNSIQYKLIKNNTNYKIDNIINDLTNRENIIKIINNKLKLKSDLLEYINFRDAKFIINDITLKSNTNNNYKTIYKLFIENFMHFHTINQKNIIYVKKAEKLFFKDLDNISNYSKMTLKLSKLCLIGILFPEFENIILKEIDTINHYLEKRKKLKTFLSYSSFKNTNDIDILRKYYDENLREFDSYFKTILNKINKKNTIIILLGDHGDALAEHKNIGHSSDYIYNENINPPFIIKIPNKKGKIFNTTIRAVDIFPTIVELIGYNIKDMKQPIYGKSFFNILNSTKKKNIVSAFVKGECNFALIKDNRWKLIYNTLYNTEELYDLKNDRQEKNNISSTNLKISSKMTEEIIDIIYKN